MSLMTMQRIMYRFIYRNKSRIIGTLLILPYLVGVVILILYPLLQTVIHSFTDTIDGEQFVGIQNFLSMKDSRAFQSAIGNSAIFYLISLPLMVILPLIGAVLYTQNSRLDVMFHHTVFLSILLPTAALMQFADLLFSEGRGQRYDDFFRVAAFLRVAQFVQFKSYFLVIHSYKPKSLLVPDYLPFQLIFSTSPG